MAGSAGARRFAEQHGGPLPRQRRAHRPVPLALSIVALGLVAAGLVFRFHNLDRKFFWEDEAWSSILIAGYIPAEVRATMLSATMLQVRDLHAFQHLSRRRGLLHVMISKASDPKHPPLYWVLLWAWAHAVGESDGTLRLFSAVVSVLAFPCLYWLCRELFDDRAVALTAVAFLAVSPLHVLYAQEARSYTLLIVVIMASSAALLRAVRVDSRFAWGVYALSVTTGLYTHLLFALVVTAHSAFVLAAARERRAVMRAHLMTFGKAAGLGILPFLPWLIPMAVAVPLVHEDIRWLNAPVSVMAAAAEFLATLCTLFIDTYAITNSTDRPAAALTFAPAFATAIQITIAVIAGYSLYHLSRSRNRTAWRFVASLAAIPLGLMLLPELIGGGRWIATARFLFPFYIAVGLSAAHLFGRKVVSGHIGERRVYRALLAVLLFGGVATCVVSGEADYWWNKGNAYLPRIARRVGEEPGATLVSDVSGDNLGKLLALSHALPDDVTLRLAPDAGVAAHVARIPAFLRRYLELSDAELTGTRDIIIDGSQGAIFVMDYSGRLLERVLHRGFVVAETCIPDRLWRIRRTNDS